MAKKVKKATRRASKRTAKPKKPTALESIAMESEGAFLQSDGRVINRQLGLLMHEVAACEEHLEGLKASAIEVRARKARAEAKILGLTRVVNRRKG